MAERTLGRSTFELSRSTVPRMAPVAFAARRRLYQPPASSVPR
jgi:hypothetical protein